MGGDSMKFPIRTLKKGETVYDVTPENCRITCGPYAYMDKVYKGNDAIRSFEPPGDPGWKIYSYKWYCSRVYIIEDSIVGPTEITLGENIEGYKTFRWGRNTRNAGNLDGRRVSDYYPDYIHGFTYDPEKVFEASKSEYFNFSPFLCGGGSCYRNPKDEKLADIFSEMKPTLPLLSKTKKFQGTLVFYYEAWGGLWRWRDEKKSPVQRKGSSGEKERDYWLTVFFL
jgi:hypothetical protein